MSNQNDNANDGPVRTVAELSHLAKLSREKFTQLGLNLKGSRFLRYMDVLSKFENVDSKVIQRAGATKHLGYTLLEVADFVEIGSLPADYLGDLAILPKLKNALKGRAFRADYQTREHDPHRDDAFELCTAAYLARFGLLGPPPRDWSDVLFRDDKVDIPIECKRLASEVGLKNSLVTGKRQLRLRRRAGAAPGLIIVDVSRALNPRLRLDHFSSPDTMTLNCGRKLHNFIMSNLTQIQHPDVVSEDVLGVVFRLSYPGYCGTVANARRYIEWSFVNLHTDDVQKALFGLCVDKFGEGPTIEKEYDGVPLYAAIQYLIDQRADAPHRHYQRSVDALPLTRFFPGLFIE